MCSVAYFHSVVYQVHATILMMKAFYLFFFSSAARRYVPETPTPAPKFPIFVGNPSDPHATPKNPIFVETPLPTPSNYLPTPTKFRCFVENPRPTPKIPIFCGNPSAHPHIFSHPEKIRCFMETPLTHTENRRYFVETPLPSPVRVVYPPRMFVCFFAQTKALVTVGKMLKKNNVAADVVSMGETDDNQVRLA